MARLSPKPRGYAARDVFQSAIQFNTACQLIRRLDHKAEPELAAFIGNPYIAVSALTIELLLKTLHALQSEHGVPHDHDLGRLYRGLGPTTRKAIQDRWDPIFTISQVKWNQLRALYAPHLKPLTPSVETALSDAALAFEQNRYAFEPDHKSGNFYVDDLREPLMGLILNRQPDFAVWTIHESGLSWEELAKKHDDQVSAAKKPEGDAPEGPAQK